MPSAWRAGAAPDRLGERAQGRMHHVGEVVVLIGPAIIRTIDRVSEL